MRVSIQIERDNQTPILFQADIAEVGKMQSISDIESFLLSLSKQALPKLGEQLIQASQDEYVSEKKR